jgi:hypothetical protein
LYKAITDKPIPNVYCSSVNNVFTVACNKHAYLSIVNIFTKFQSTAATAFSQKLNVLKDVKKTVRKAILYIEITRVSKGKMKKLFLVENVYITFWFRLLVIENRVERYVVVFLLLFYNYKSQILHLTPS